MVESIIKPLRPSAASAGWQPLPLPSDFHNAGYPVERWMHASGLVVLSGLEVAVDDDGIDRGPEYHVSVSKLGRRCSSNEARWVLDVFGIPEAEEDNHVPGGIARNFWRPVANRFVGLECACKDEEPVMKEDRGDYVWRG